MIPQFDEFGNLPYRESTRGIIETNLADVRSVYVTGFSDSVNRPLIFSGYGTYLQTLNNLNLTCPQLLDGSFVTAKKCPGDIDIVNLFDAVYYDNLSDPERASAGLLLGWGKRHFQFINKSIFKTHTLPCPVYPEGHPNKERITDMIFAQWLGLFTQSKSLPEQKKGILSVSEADIKQALSNHGFFDFEDKRPSEGSLEEELMIEQQKQQFENRSLASIREDISYLSNMLKDTNILIEETPDIPSLHLVKRSVSGKIRELSQEYAFAVCGNPEAQAFLLNLSGTDFQFNAPIAFLAKMLEYVQSIVTQIARRKQYLLSGNKMFSGITLMDFGGVFEGSLGLILLETPPKDKEPVTFHVPGALNLLGESLKTFTDLLDCRYDKDKIKQMADDLGIEPMVSYRKMLLEIQKYQADVQFAHPGTRQSTYLTRELAGKIYSVIREREEIEIETRRVTGELKVVDLLDRALTIAIPKPTKTVATKSQKEKFDRFDGKFIGEDMEEKVKSMLDRTVEAVFEIETTIEEGTGKPKEKRRLISIRQIAKQENLFNSQEE